MADGCNWSARAPGLHLTGFLPPGVDDAAVAKQAAFELGVSVIPLSSCCLAPPSRGGLVLGYGGADEAAIEAGVAALAQILRDVPEPSGRVLA